MRQINQFWADLKVEGRLVVVGTPTKEGATVAVCVDPKEGASVLTWESSGPSKIDDVIEHPQEEVLIFSSQLDDRIYFFVHPAPSTR